MLVWSLNAEPFRRSVLKDELNAAVQLSGLLPNFSVTDGEYRAKRMTFTRELKIKNENKSELSATLYKTMS
jgi:hypothetical protein